MKRFQSIYLPALCILSVLCGCNHIPEPVFLTKEPAVNIDEKRIILSNQSAYDGWQCLRDYHMRGGRIFDLEMAMRFFNHCWSFNPNNYNAYWGIGIIQGERATLSKDEKEIETYMKQSVEFILKAKELNLPLNETNRLLLDLANAYNGQGHFNQLAGKKSAAIDSLMKSAELLDKVIKEEPENGRAYFLKAANLFYQEDYKDAQKMVIKAQGNGFVVPEDFIKDLNKRASYYNVMHDINI